MIHELRIYDTFPGCLVALNEEFAGATTKLFAKHGIHGVGYWTDVIGTSNRLVYLVEFDDLEKRQRAWDAFREDPDWQAVIQAHYQQGTPLVSRITNTILRPTAYSPQRPRGGQGWVYELRMYDVAPGHLPDLHQRFANVTTRLFEKHGIHNIGYWTEEVGVNNRLDYLVAYEGLGARDQVWAAFRQDPDWQEAARRAQETGRPTVLRITNTVMSPTTYSPLQ